MCGSSCARTGSGPRASRNEKGPDLSGPWLETLVAAAVWATAQRNYFLPPFFGAAFFFAGAFAAFLVAFFIDRFSLNIEFAISVRPQCDSYIRSSAIIVKEKVNGSGLNGTSRAHRSAKNNLN